MRWFLRSRCQRSEEETNTEQMGVVVAGQRGEERSDIKQVYEGEIPLKVSQLLKFKDVS